MRVDGGAAEDGGGGVLVDDGPRTPRTAEEFAEWVRPHWPAMAGLAARLGGPHGEDALQKALGAAWRKREQYDASRGTPRAWLLAVVADQGRKAWRTRRPEPVDPISAEVGAAPAEDREARLDLARALTRLRPPAARRRAAPRPRVAAGRDRLRPRLRRGHREVDAVRRPQEAARRDGEEYQ